MKKVVLIFLLSMTLMFAKEQLDWVAFAAGEGGAPSNTVTEMDNLVEDKDINKIRELIYSDDIALKGLSVIVLELLKEKNLIELDDDELSQIEILHSSGKELIYTSGCTFEKVLTLSDFLDSDSGIRSQARRRYIQMIEEYYLNE